MKEWFNSLAPRERIMVSAAAVVVVLAILYLALWEPLNTSVEQLHKRVRQQKQLVAWLHQKEPRIKELRAKKGQTAPKAQGDSILSIINRSSEKAGLRSSIKRIQPQNDQLVRIWIEEATFNDVVTWLHRLDRQYGISVNTLDLKPASHMGQVKGNMRLHRPGGSGP